MSYYKQFVDNKIKELKMTIKESILKSLSDIGSLATYIEVYENIIYKGYYDFKKGKTPKRTIQPSSENLFAMEIVA